MESRIAKAIGLKHHPVAVLRSNEAPENALRFKPGKWGCVMFMFANAAKGKTTAFDRETYGCWGGGVGLGFGNAYLHFPGGTDCFAYFLSSGNEEWEQGRQVGKALEGAAGKEFAENFLKGERYVKTPEFVKEWIQTMPIQDIPEQVVLFKPLTEVDPNVEKPASVALVVNPDQLSALVVLANYGREGFENVSIPFAAGCQTIGLLPFEEAKGQRPRAVVGLTDLSARKYVRTLLGRDYLSFTMPWELFEAMERDVVGSFLERNTWQSLMKPEG